MKQSLSMKYITILFACFLSYTSMAQLGGENTYEFLNLPTSARIAALGGNLITVQDDDAALAYQNPALLNAAMDNQITFSNNFYFAGINHGYAAYAKHLKKANLTVHGGVQFIDYGDFTQANQQGQITGNFDAGEYAVMVGTAYQYSERISIGANVKWINSQFESYNSTALAGDLAIAYADTGGRTVLTFVVKNLGSQLTSYAPDTKENLPFDIQFGVSRKLKYLPFRFSVVYDNLHRWNVLYDDPNAEPTTLAFGEVASEPSAISVIVDNFFRHIIVNGELLLGKRENFRLRIGYNHRRRAELSVDNTISFAGFSFGAGFKVKRFRLDFGRAVYHLAGGTTHLTLSTSINEFRKGK